ncbi:hypothetical protein [Prosthecobacter vanneervenii]|uniref:Uncharacterized protein n=1 Tax=Prosthecobacter vanneervenii TaxID=48466 RepID=A0A7W7Y6W5_9BACT|nr:hypothetical protein [Prosthecobacter vanneervenii]MBB5030721.1 hypothetical protein [Prosthecobacter vanneervenii]
MSDSPPPLPPSSQPAPPPAEGVWWLAWIIATVIAPGAAVPVSNGLPPTEISVASCWTAAAAILILHIVASVKLGRNRSGCMAVALTFGGWLLMLTSFFVGCVSMMNNMSHR